jgi:uncharacterized membrane protein YeaQ/YmgE (transglycosylase-associated protein family)
MPPSRPRALFHKRNASVGISTWMRDAFVQSHLPGEELGRRFRMNIIAWIVLGAIAGYLAGFLVKGDESYGVIGHIVLGIVGALVGGFLAGVLFGIEDPIQGALDISTIVIAVIGAIIAVVVFNLVTGRARTGRGAV